MTEKQKRVFKRLLSYLDLRGYFSKKVGTIFYSHWLASTIIVTRHFNDRHWYFKKYDLMQGIPHGKELQASTPLSYFEYDKCNHPNFNREPASGIANKSVPPPFRGASYRKHR